jgi:hypothetical protein
VRGEEWEATRHTAAALFYQQSGGSAKRAGVGCMTPELGKWEQSKGISRHHQKFCCKRPTLRDLDCAQLNK